MGEEGTSNCNPSYVLTSWANPPRFINNFNKKQNAKTIKFKRT